MMRRGRHDRLGNTPDADGTHFAVYSAAAERMELCLFDSSGNETARHALPERHNGIWSGFLPGCKPGQQYGYRVHGRYDPENGQRFNPQKLLIDPYANRLAGTFHWSDAVFDYASRTQHGKPNTDDSASCIPKGVVDRLGVRSSQPVAARRVSVPWSEAVVYEANVRGYTMRHPDVPRRQRGTFRGMRNGDIIRYLQALGITAVELMPVHEFIDEQFLVRQGLRNFWGYNSINFFTPAGRYALIDPVQEFRDMVDAIHDAGLEVILDVAYNHTGEGDSFGPSISFRGLDNLSYYRTEAQNAGHYINDTGCGNTINTPHSMVRRLIVDSLCYWSNDMGVDGFRFDLATVNGRTPHGFDPQHELFADIENADALRGIRMIAEPWDPGIDGYQLGRFPAGWSEWNDRYRDDVRRFWRGESNASDFAKRLHGSSDVFETAGRPPQASLNFISSHDGFTLNDIVSYERRHNEANGEDNRDGHRENSSRNYGIEGASDDAAIVRVRRKQRLNMLATLLFSQGTPMLLAGDEFGQSQAGNNNAYAQDNETSWLDWSALKLDPGFQHQVRRLLSIRHDTPLLRQRRYRHDAKAIRWLLPNALPVADHDWQGLQAFTLLLRDAGNDDTGAVVAIHFNGSEQKQEFRLPADLAESDLRMRFCSDVTLQSLPQATAIMVPQRTIVLLSAN